MAFNESNVTTIAYELENTFTEGLTAGEKLLSLAGLRIVQIVNHVILSGTVCFLGIIANIINMIIFVMQGLNNTMNISFFAMAISDLCSLVTLEWLNINLNPFMDGAEVPFEPSEVQYLTGGWPHACFARITCWITVYVTVERCLCIAVPLKVKQIITPARTRIAICSIYFFMFLTLTPEYVTLYFGEKFIEWRNETRVGLVYYESYREKLKGFAFIFYAIIGMVSFATVIFFTCLLIIKLKSKAKWRKKSTSDRGQNDNMTNRDKKAMKMVVLIASILIACFTPAMCLYVTVFLVPEFDLVGEYSTIFHATWSVAFLSEAINSSVNIFLYYKMSSKYRETFQRLFPMCKCIQSEDSGKSAKKSDKSSLKSSKRPSSSSGVTGELDVSVSTSKTSVDQPE